jgi:hypothetical protein
MTMNLLFKDELTFERQSNQCTDTSNMITAIVKYGNPYWIKIITSILYTENMITNVIIFLVTYILYANIPFQCF